MSRSASCDIRSATLTPIDFVGSTSRKLSSAERAALKRRGATGDFLLSELVELHDETKPKWTKLFSGKFRPSRYTDFYDFGMLRHRYVCLTVVAGRLRDQWEPPRYLGEELVLRAVLEHSATCLEGRRTKQRTRLPIYWIGCSITFTTSSSSIRPSTESTNPPPTKDRNWESTRSTHQPGSRHFVPAVASTRCSRYITETAGRRRSDESMRCARRHRRSNTIAGHRVAGRAFSLPILSGCQGSLNRSAVPIQSGLGMFWHALI